jgi:hypothetical protein
MVAVVAPASKLEKRKAASSEEGGEAKQGETEDLDVEPSLAPSSDPV